MSARPQAAVPHLRRALVGTALLAAATACGGAPPSPVAGGPASSAAPASGPVRDLSLTVTGSTVAGDTGTVPVGVGERVRLTVTSDVADEVHVHGADVSRPVPAGGTVTLEFAQPAPGRFEVELEQRRQVLTRLQVR